MSVAAPRTTGERNERCEETFRSDRSVNYIDWANNDFAGMHIWQNSTNSTL